MFQLVHKGLNVVIYLCDYLPACIIRLRDVLLCFTQPVHKSITTSVKKDCGYYTTIASHVNCLGFKKNKKQKKKSV